MADSDRPTETAQPGQVIAPGASVGPDAAPAAPVPTPAEPLADSPTPSSEPASPGPEPLSPPAAATETRGPSLAQQDQHLDLDPTASTLEPVSWTASEFIAHEKNFGWYLGLVAVTVVLSGAVYFITKDMVSTAVVLVCALALGVLANRKPRQMQYALSTTGVTIGSKHFDYGAFKSFSVVPEGAFSSVIFTPLKRFAPPTTIYYAPQDEDRILGMLSNFLPIEEHRPDAVDSLARRIRF